MNGIIKRLLLFLLTCAVIVSPVLSKKRDTVGTSSCLSEGAVSCGLESGGQNVKISSRFLELLFGSRKDSSKETDGKKLLLLTGGDVFGARIKQTYVTVADPLEHRELKAGDKIIKINGKDVRSVKDIESIIYTEEHSSIDAVIMRGEKTLRLTITPKKANGESRLGIILRDGAAGIGTMTYIDPETGLFGGLGHGICDAQSGEVIEMSSGNVTGVILGGVKKGEPGKPGELSGILTEKINGSLYANTECGVFGKLDKIPDKQSTVAIEVGHRENVHAGEAKVISTVKTGTTKAFTIEITDVNTSSRGTKSFKIKVTDPALIALTGGVVRGMSGSPIVQDGKLIGALTHVMIGEPTEGYGIFIENMLETAETALHRPENNAA